MPVKEICRDGGMVDTLDSKSCAFAGVRVRVSLAAPNYFALQKNRKEKELFVFNNQ